MAHDLGPAPNGNELSWIAERFAELERRLAEMERSSQLPSSSFQGGGLAFQDDAGNDRLVLGNATIPSNPSGGEGDKYGGFAYGDGGAVVLGWKEGNRGLVYPNQPIPFYDTNASISVSGSSYETTWETVIDTPPGEVAVVKVLAGSSGFTGNLRLYDAYSGTFTDTADITADGLWSVSWQWLHPAVCGWGDTRPGRQRYLDIQVQAKRNTGAGAVNVFAPNPAYITSLEFAAAGLASGSPLVSP